MTESPSVPVTTGQPSYRSDPSLSSRGGAGCRGGGEGGRAGSGGLGGASAFGGRSYPSFTDTILQSAAASCSSSLRSAHTAHNALGPLISEGTTSTSYKSLANQTRNGSLSYESLLTPSESPEFESAAHELSPPRPHPPHSLSTAPGAPPILGYTSPFLSAQQREGSLQACPAPLRPSPTELSCAQQAHPLLGLRPFLLALAHWVPLLLAPPLAIHLWANHCPMEVAPNYSTAPLAQGAGLRCRSE